MANAQNSECLVRGDYSKLLGYLFLFPSSSSSFKLGTEGLLVHLPGSQAGGGGAACGWGRGQRKDMGREE